MERSRGPIGEAMRARRLALRLKQARAAADAGLSEATWNASENGRSKSWDDATKIAICGSLGWTPDSFERIERGDDPIEVARVIVGPTASPESHDGSEGWPSWLESWFEARFAELEQRIRDQDQEIEKLKQQQRRPSTG